jgi:hypothetical protein
LAKLLSRFLRRPSDAQGFRAVRLLYRSIRKINLPEVRALRLLRQWLPAEQLSQFDALHFFDVVGCHTARRYRIYYAASQNVEMLDEFGRSVERFCFIPEGDLAPGDVMLAQKIALETDELAALGVANRLPIYAVAPRRDCRGRIP